MKIKIYMFSSFTFKKYGKRSDIIKLFKEFKPNKTLLKNNVNEFVICPKYKIYWSNVHLNKEQITSLINVSKEMKVSDSITISI